MTVSFPLLGRIRVGSSNGAIVSISIACHLKPCMRFSLTRLSDKKEYKRVTATIQCSYSKKAYPWDNACIESFHSLIKREWLNQFKNRDYEHTYRLVFEYLEAFYNTKRIHSHCDYMSLNDYEDLYRRLQLDELQLAG